MARESLDKDKSDIALGARASEPYLGATHELDYRISDDEGAVLVRLARRAIRDYLEKKRVIDPPSGTSPRLTQKVGVFVTLKTSSMGKNELRGCMGYSEATFPLAQATIQAAISSAVEDPRFSPVTLKEMDAISIEVSVLSPLQQILIKNHTDYRDHLRIGEDGLVIEHGLNKGLLLPQVAVEWKWDAEDFLSNACLKAGLLPDSWLLPGTKVYKFQVSLFEEEFPDGPIRRTKIDTEERTNGQ